MLRARRPAPSGCILVLATNTWNAYNDFGGRNLYTGATAVSFERPLTNGMLEKPTEPGERLVDGGREYIEYTARHALNTWHGMAGWAGQERRFANWAARAGVELDFATNRDLEDDPDLLDGYRLYLSVGHDEYWSWAMRDTVEHFVASGGNAAFFSGNTCYWQVRTARGRMTCFKHRFLEDPLYGVDNARLTTMWSDPLVSRPENELTGVSFTRGGYHRIFRSVPRGAGGYEVHRPDHWLLDGTDLRRGDLLGSRARRRRLRVRRLRLHVPQRAPRAHRCGRHVAAVRSRRDRARDTVRPCHHAVAPRTGRRVRARIPRPPAVR